MEFKTIQLAFDSSQQVRDVIALEKPVAERFERAAPLALARGGVPARRQFLQLRFVLRTLGLDRQPGSLETPLPDVRRRATRPLFPHLVEFLVEGEDFLQQPGRHLLRCLFGPLRRQPFELQQVFDARDGMAERSIRVVQVRRLLQARAPLGRGGVVEVIGMKLPAERAIALFEVSHVEVQLAGKAEETEEVGATRQMNCHSRTSISRWGC